MIVIPIVIGALGTVNKGIGTGMRGLGNKWTSGDHPNYSIIEIDQNTEKSPGDFRRLVTQTPVKNHHLNAGVKNSLTSKIIIIIIICRRKKP